MKFFKKNRNPSYKELTIFFQQFATLISANIPIQQSCQLLLQTQSNKHLQKVIRVLKTEVEAGRSIAYSLKKFPHIFNTFICSLIQIGESTGTLEKILQQISILLEKSLHLRNQIKQALFYPLTVLSISLLVCLLMLIFIVPRFIDFFHDLHSPLPKITLAIVWLSNFIRKEYALVIGIGITIILLLKHFKLSFLYKQYLKHWTYQLPLINRLVDQFFILYFVKNLSIIYSSGINIIDGLKLIAEINDYPRHQSIIFRLREQILTGNQLNVSLRFCTIFPLIVIQMTRIGEETGTLQTMFSTIEHLYEAELDRIILQMNLLLEPLIMLILGVLIGGLVIAMYLPIFRIGMAV